MLDTIFSIAGALAMLGWLGLALLPGQRVVVEVITRMAIPAIIAVVYAVLMAVHLAAAPPNAGYGSLAAVSALFSVKGLLLAGWIHYLAFDLFVGSWEVTDARSSGIPHVLVLPCLFATFMIGPVGLGLYLLVKAGHRAFAGRRADAPA